MLTFPAGAEVDVPQFRREWNASISIGLVSFFAPFAVVGLLCYYALGWNHRQAEIGGLALSTTSLAVVYAVLVETGLNRELVGKRIMSATFVTDICTVAGLTVLFVTPTIWIVPFVLVSVALIVGLPRLSPWFLALRRPRDRARDQARLRSPLPADVARRPRRLAGGTPGVRPRPGHEWSLRRAAPGARSASAPRFAQSAWAETFIPPLRKKNGVRKAKATTHPLLPLARRYAAPHATFTTLLMSTGLTFGTITSLYGLNAGIIDRTQFSLLIAVVVLFAIVPTAIAQRFFQPRPFHERETPVTPMPPAPAGEGVGR